MAKTLTIHLNDGSTKSFEHETATIGLQAFGIIVEERGDGRETLFPWTSFLYAETNGIEPENYEQIEQQRAIQRAIANGLVPEAQAEPEPNRAARRAALKVQK